MDSTPLAIRRNALASLTGAVAAHSSFGGGGGGGGGAPRTPPKSIARHLAATTGNEENVLPPTTPPLLASVKKVTRKRARARALITPLDPSRRGDVNLLYPPAIGKGACAVEKKMPLSAPTADTNTRTPIVCTTSSSPLGRLPLGQSGRRTPADLFGGFALAKSNGFLSTRRKRKELGGSRAASLSSPKLKNVEPSPSSSSSSSSLLSSRVSSPPSSSLPSSQVVEDHQPTPEPKHQEQDIGNNNNKKKKNNNNNNGGGGGGGNYSNSRLCAMWRADMKRARRAMGRMQAVTEKRRLEAENRWRTKHSDGSSGGSSSNENSSSKGTKRTKFKQELLSFEACVRAAGEAGNVVFQGICARVRSNSSNNKDNDNEEEIARRALARARLLVDLELGSAHHREEMDEEGTEDEVLAIAHWRERWHSLLSLLRSDDFFLFSGRWNRPRVPLFLRAVREGYVLLVLALHAAFPDIKLPTTAFVPYGEDRGRTATACAACWGSPSSHLPILIFVRHEFKREGFASAAPMFLKHGFGGTALTDAAFWGNAVVLKYLLSLVPCAEVMRDVTSARDKDGSTVLIQAAKQGHTQVLRFLLSDRRVASVLDVGAADKNGLTFLHWSVRQGHGAATHEIVKIMKEREAEEEEMKGEDEWERGEERSLPPSSSTSLFDLISRPDRYGSSPLITATDQQRILPCPIARARKEETGSGSRRERHDRRIVEMEMEKQERRKLGGSGGGGGGGRRRQREKQEKVEEYSNPFGLSESACKAIMTTPGCLDSRSRRRRSSVECAAILVEVAGADANTLWLEERESVYHRGWELQPLSCAALACDVAAVKYFCDLPAVDAMSRPVVSGQEGVDWQSFQREEEKGGAGIDHDRKEKSLNDDGDSSSNSSSNSNSEDKEKEEEASPRYSREDRHGRRLHLWQRQTSATFVRVLAREALSPNRSPETRALQVAPAEITAACLRYLKRTPVYGLSPLEVAVHSFISRCTTAAAAEKEKDALVAREEVVDAYRIVAVMTRTRAEVMAGTATTSPPGRLREREDIASELRDGVLALRAGSFHSGVIGCYAGGEYGDNNKDNDDENSGGEDKSKGARASREIMLATAARTMGRQRLLVPGGVAVDVAFCPEHRACIEVVKKMQEVVDKTRKRLAHLHDAVLRDLHHSFPMPEAVRRHSNGILDSDACELLEHCCEADAALRTGSILFWRLSSLACLLDDAMNLIFVRRLREMKARASAAEVTAAAIPATATTATAAMAPSEEHCKAMRAWGYELEQYSNTVRWARERLPDMMRGLCINGSQAMVPPLLRRSSTLREELEGQSRATCLEGNAGLEKERVQAQTKSKGDRRCSLSFRLSNAAVAEARPHLEQWERSNVWGRNDIWCRDSGEEKWKKQQQWLLHKHRVSGWDPAWERAWKHQEEGRRRAWEAAQCVEAVKNGELGVAKR